MKKIDYPAITICGQGMIQDVLNGATKKQFEDYILDVKGKNLTGLKYRVKRGVLSEDQIKKFWNEYIQVKFPGSEVSPNTLVHSLATQNPDESINARALTNPDSVGITDSCPDGFIDTSSSGEKFPDFDVKCIKLIPMAKGKPDLCASSGAEKLYFTNKNSDQKNKGFASGLHHAIYEGGIHFFIKIKLIRAVPCPCRACTYAFECVGN